MYTLSSLNCISSLYIYIYIYIIVIIVTNSCDFYLQLVIFEILLSYHHHYFWTDNAFNFMFSNFKIYHTIYSIYLSYCGCLNLSYCGWQREILKPPVLNKMVLYSLYSIGFQHVSTILLVVASGRTRRLVISWCYATARSLQLTQLRDATLTGVGGWVGGGGC